MSFAAPTNPVVQASPTKSLSERCMHAKRAFNQNAEVISLACDQWSCDYCGKINAWRWAQRIRYGIALWPDHRAYFWTLTLPPWVVDPKTGYKILPARWAALRQTLKRSIADFQYAAFVEGHPHRAFIPHLHIITLHAAPRRLKDMAMHAGFGFEAKEVQINSGMAVSYVAKYASKQGQGMPRNFRRVRISRDWPALPTPEYPLAVYPMRQGEALAGYLLRMSAQLGASLELLRDVYLDHSRDIH